MTEFLAQNWILSIFLTIFLGAIGSGLWDVAFRPVLKGAGELLFNAMTFGAKRSRDRIYKNAAMGHHELPSLYVLLFVVAGMVALLGTSQGFFFATLYIEKTPFEDVKAICDTADFPDRLRCRKEVIKQGLEGIIAPMILFSIFMALVIFYRF